MTKKEMYVAIRERVIDDAEMVEFIDHELDLLNRKYATRSKKPTKKQLENEAIKDEILDALKLSDEPISRVQLCDVCPSLQDLTPQKVTALMTQLRKDGLVKRDYDKKTPLYSLGCEGE